MAKKSDERVMSIAMEEGDWLVVRIPCSVEDIKRAPKSEGRKGKGRYKLLATSHGFVAIDGAPEGTKINLNVISPVLPP